MYSAFLDKMLGKIYLPRITNLVQGAPIQFGMSWQFIRERNNIPSLQFLYNQER
jgi:hypothetical protein